MKIEKPAEVVLKPADSIAQKSVDIKPVATEIKVPVVTAPVAAQATPTKIGYQKEIPLAAAQAKAQPVQIQAVQVSKPVIADKKPIDHQKVGLRDDIMDGPDEEDNEIMKSIAYAE